MVNRYLVIGVLFGLLLASLPGCIAEDLQVEGRPCGSNLPCGPGTVCDPSTNLCVAAQLTDSAIEPDVLPDTNQGTDLDKGTPDSDLLPDLLQPDQFIAPDGGCPSGLKRCGNVCVDTLKDLNHCGSCNNKCPGATTDSCVNGICGCGKGSSSSKPSPCTGNLNCKSGSCSCVVGGLCVGCCLSNTCVSVGSSQSATKCGKGGAACKKCDDSNICTDDTCNPNGVCLYTPQAKPVTCNDNNLCTYGDKCTSAGKCQGTSYSCSDGLSCTTDTCTGTGSCSYPLKKGYCAIGLGSAKKTCYANGAIKSGTSCFVCDTSKSTLVWTYSSTCLAGINVSSVMPFGSFNWLRDVIVSSSGVLVVADAGYHAIRQISGTTITTVAGVLGSSGHVNGAKASSKFNQPYQLAADSSGNIYVADRGNNAIRKIYASGSVVTLAGSSSLAGSDDGSTSTAKFYYPSGVALGSNGAVYVADTNNHTIRRIYGTSVTTIAGKAGSAGSTNGAYGYSRFYYPHGIAFYGNKLYVADMYNNMIRVVDLSSSSYPVSLVAGTGSTGSKDGPVATAWFNRPADLAVSTSGRIYVVEYSGHKLRMISDGQVVTLAGTGANGYQDGTATLAKFNSPAGISLTTVSSKGWIYIADYANRTVRLVKLTTAP